MTLKLIDLRTLAGAIGAYKRCVIDNNAEWEKKWKLLISHLESLLPSGFGLDSGCKIEVDESNDDKVVISTSYHHMDSSGGYDGWTSHKIILTPSFNGGFSIKVTGWDRNCIKDYLCDTFHSYFIVTTNEQYSDVITEYFRAAGIDRVICTITEKGATE